MDATQITLGDLAASIEIAKRVAESSPSRAGGSGTSHAPDLVARHEMQNAERLAAARALGVEIAEALARTDGTPGSSSFREKHLSSFRSAYGHKERSGSDLVASMDRLVKSEQARAGRSEERKIEALPPAVRSGLASSMDRLLASRTAAPRAGGGEQLVSDVAPAARSGMAASMDKLLADVSAPRAA